MNHKNGNYFITITVTQQLVTILQNSEVKLINQEHLKDDNTGLAKDILYGKVYKELIEDGKSKWSIIVD